MTNSTPAPTLRHTPLFLLLLSCFGPAHAQSQVTPSLPEVSVVDSSSESPDLEARLAKERTRLNNVPGGVNLVAPQERVRLQTLNDALANQPGIVVQEFFGGIDQPRLNIRGSGIQSNPVNRGVLLLQDGMPLNEADGSFVMGLLEPRNAGLIAVRRGANAEHASANTLGGELDFQSITGAQLNRVDASIGSFGRKSLSASVGGQAEDWDAHVFASHDEADGYRHHSASKRSSLHANAGWRSGSLENRTYLSYTDLEFEIPNVIPGSRLRSDPRSVLGDYNEPADKSNNIYIRDPNRQTQQLRLANRTTWGTDALRHSFGVYWQSVDDTFTSPTISSPTDGHTFGAQWTSHGRSGNLEYHFGLHWARTDMDRDLRVVNGTTGERLPAPAQYKLQAENRSANAGVSWNIAPDWKLIGDLRYVQAIRDASQQTTGTQLNQQWNSATPRVGAIWQASDATQVFANLSRSSEAPTYWEIISGDVSNPMNTATFSTSMNRLKLQRAWTLEAGTRSRFGKGRNAGEWSISAYRSHVDDELMAVTNANGTSAGTFNYNGRTVHQGIEAGLKGQWAVGNGTIRYQGAYTFNDFRFRNGEFSGNTIAGVPKHLLGAEISYHHGAWSAGPTLRWQPTKTQTNHANVAGTEQDSYALLGLRVTYQPHRNWHAYLSVDNLTDRTYASAFVIRSTGTSAMPTFLSGNGRSIHAGLSYRF
ncbi:TonB-dependent receptor family protein [Diaphorobacter caeni]|uniref:TonB-dependent receptor family protein n=1 Tax=Diaphorobacter caeni TaxID=2784387 RepID=UPI00188E3B3B|nr:TonB-dependent receptor [Diaphorobacter caeni]MBF5005848.1 TonB-dependent receptor [Diaphorobacter caeni]